MRACLRQRLAAIAAALVLIAGASSATAEESYHMVLFAFDGTPRAPRVSHTFAVFVKAEFESGKEATAKLQAYPISWSTARPNPRLLALRAPDPGVNLDLPATFNLAAAMNARVTAFGPYRIKKELFDRAEQQFQRLNSGMVAYKMLDGATRVNGAINCIHAVSDIAPAGMLNTGTAFGVDATAVVRQHMSPWILVQDKTNDNGWLIDRLRLNDPAISFVSEPLPPKETLPAPLPK